MSTDPKKYIKMAIFAYFLAGMFLLSSMQMTYSWIPVLIFSSIATVLYVSCALSLWKQYQKYHLPLYIFLMLLGIGLALFTIIISILSLM